MAEPVRMDVGALTDLVTRAFAASGVARGNAESVARALVAAEIDGQAGHGLSRVASYAGQARTGKVAGDAVPEVTRAAPGWLAVDAGHGFAYPALAAAREALVPVVREQGMAGAAIRRSHHCGQLGAQVEALAEAGLVALMVANTPKAMAAWGGRAALFGTNPIAFAAPREGEAPLVIDLSLSKVARGKVMAAKKANAPIPEGIALDAEGQPTTDPDAALAGTMVPAGEAKGAALALMVEVLAATLTGATASREASSFFEAEGASPGVGQLLLGFDPGRTPPPGFGAGIEALVAAMEADPDVRLPGSRRPGLRARAATEGLAVPAHIHDEIRRLADAG